MDLTKAPAQGASHTGKVMGDGVALRNIVGLLILVTIGVAVFAFADGLDLKGVRRDARLSLGLPKFWPNEFNEAVSRNTELPCPQGDAIVIVTGGQSNAANSYDPPPPPDSNPHTLMFYNGKCYKLRSPVLGASGDNDSLWPALGQKLNAATGRPVVFINGAEGGTQIGDWLDNRSGYLTRLANQVLAARKAGLAPDMVLWIQGETDAAVKLEPAKYVSQQRSLIDKLDRTGATDERIPWVVFLSTRCAHRATNGPEIEQALKDESARPGSRILIGPDVTSYDDDLRRDACHLNARGRDRLASEAVAALTNKNLIQFQHAFAD